MSQDRVWISDLAKTVRDYLCASCWGHLVVENRPGVGLIVVCPQCGVVGLHSKNFVARMQAEDRERAAEAWHNLTAAGIFRVQRRAPERILAELGF